MDFRFVVVVVRARFDITVVCTIFLRTIQLKATVGELEFSGTGRDQTFGVVTAPEPGRGGVCDRRL